LTWAPAVDFVDMADEFPHVDVTGVDLAPLQPRVVPSNCTLVQTTFRVHEQSL
jgi:hypothetical protein